MADRHSEDLCGLVCVFQSCETSTSHSVCRSDFTTTTFLIYLTHLLPLSPISFWLWPVLLYFSRWSPRRPQVSASVSRPGNANTPTEGRGVDLLSSLLWNKLTARPSACNTTPSDWILDFGFWNGLGWPDTAGGCC